MTVPSSLLVPAAIVLAGVVISLLLDAFERAVAAIGALVAALALASLAGLWLVANGGASTGAAFAAAGPIIVLSSLAYALAACALLGGYAWFLEREQGVATATLVAIGTMLAAALMAAVDVVVFFVALSGLGVVGYALAAASGSRRAEESALRYFVQGAVASGLTVYAVALLVSASGGAIAYHGPGDLGVLGRPSLLAAAFLVASLGFKVGAFPFHSWVPDVYENARAPIAAFLGSVPKMAGITALLVLAESPLLGGGRSASVSVMISVLAAGSLLFGAFGMLRQRSVARLIGYSAIAQVGYALMAIAAGTSPRAVLIFAGTYAIAACAAFVGLEAVARVRPEWDGRIEGLAGLSRRSPALAGAMSVVMLSLTGIPPLAGFWGKFVTLAAAVEGDLAWLAVIAAIAAVVSFGGYGLVIRWMYFHSEGDSALGVEGRPGIALWVVIALSLALIAIGLAPLVGGPAVLGLPFSR